MGNERRLMWFARILYALGFLTAMAALFDLTPRQPDSWMFPAILAIGALFEIAAAIRSGR
jgi:hypothetical protein